MTVKDTKAALALHGGGWEYGESSGQARLSQGEAWANRPHLTLIAHVSGTGNESARTLEQSARSALVDAIKEHWKA